MSTDQQVRDVIRSLGDTGPDPDVDAAWRRVETRLDGASTPSGAWARRGAIGLAAAAALVVVLLVARPEDQGAIRIDSAGDPAAGQDEQATTDAALGDPVTFPADAIVVPGPEWTALHVLDAASGELAGTVTPPPDGTTLPSGAVTADGDVWFVAQTEDGPRIGRTRWDAGDAYDFVAVDPSPGAVPGEIAVDAGGRSVAAAVMDSEGTCWIAIHAPATGESRALRWTDGDQRGSYRCPSEMSFSPDGSELAFLNVHDSDGTEPFEAFVVDVDAAALAGARLVSAEAWDITFDPAGGLLALVGPTRDAATLRYLEGGPDVGVPPRPGIVDLQASLGSVVVHLEDGWVRLDPERDEWIPTPIGRWTGG